MRRSFRPPTRLAAVVPAAVASALAVSACGPAPDAGLVVSDVGRNGVTVADTASVDDVVAATQRLGLTMLDPTTGGDTVGQCAPSDQVAPVNVVSPASLAVALAMLAEGAEGHTAQELDAALGATGTERTDAYNALIAAVGEYDGDPGVAQDDDLPERPVLHLADQVVLDDGFAAKQDYLDALAAAFGAGVQQADLSTQDGKAVLDAWVQKHSGGLIERSAIEPDPDLRLVLQNAVVLVAGWQTPMGDPFDAPFRLPDGTEVQAEAVGEGLHVARAEHDGWTAVRLPYTEGFHADVILPPEGEDPVPDDAVATALDAALTAAEPASVQVTMPTLDIATEPVDLCPALSAAGLGGLFTDPDLNGISDKDLVIQQAAQQAVLKVDGDGTVAAAVTEIGAAVTSAEIADDTFTVDRPYTLRIAHAPTGWPLFLASISDPRH
ncbi:serpin family protein [Antribacter sp. KLBMP9083]|uniref:Serpin family protein n=1 Tax=Antribacter soli TaxID=2910976 RepID=A0AA41QCM0_9MICO|nr:serpin family protein [Antribacter soli]MCF4120985.1 serpin family protein [Antribacter soli]